MADFELQVALDTSPVLRQILDIGRRLDETFSRVKPLGITADTTQAETKLAALAKTVIRPRVDPDLGTFSSRFDKQIIDAEKKVIALQSELAGAIIEGASAQEIEKIRQALGAAEGEAKKFRAALNSAQGIGGAGGATEAPATTTSPIAVPKNAAFQFNQITQSVTTLSNAVSGLSAPFIELDTATQSLKTLGAEAAAMAPNLREAAIAMSSELPFAAAEIQQTMFDALASGVKGGEEGLKGFADTAAKLAVGGGAQIAESTNLLAGQLNAYGKSAEEAGKFSDIFFNTVNYGVTSIPALANSLSNVIPTAAAAGVELENVGAALAVMTSKGVPTAQSTTKLNQLLLEIQKPGAALAGVLKKAGVSMESLKQDDLPVTLEKINSALKATGQTATTAFSSSEASAAFNVLAGDLEGFKQTFLDVRDTTGSTQFAYEQMADGIASRTKQMQVIVEGFAIKGFDLLGNGFVTLTQSATQLAPTVATLAGLKGILPEGMGARAVELGRSLLSTVVPSLFATEGAAATTGFSFSGMWAAATGPVGLVIAGIVAIVAIIAVLYNKFEAVRNVLDAVFEGFLDIAQKWGAAAAEFGGLLFDVLVAPFELLWAFVSPLVGAIGDLFSSIFSGAGNAGGAVSGIAAVFEFLGNVLDTVKATFAGFRAGLAEFIAVIGEIVDRVKNLDFSGAADVALKAGDRIAGAMKEGFQSNLKQSNLNDELAKANDTLGAGLKIKAKIDSLNGIDSLQKSLVAAQEQLKPLELKVRAGTATEEEKKSFEELQKKVVETSAKIAEIAPEAVAGTRSMVNSNGQLVDVYDINAAKLGEVAKAQKEAFGKDVQGEQKKYSDSLLKVAATLDEQKKKLSEVKSGIDAANAKGDTKTADRLKEEYAKLNEQITANSAGLKKGFEDGAKAGLLTKDATDKIGSSLGIAKGKAGEVAEQIKKAGEEAEKAAFNVNKIGEGFDAAKKAAKDLLDQSQTNAAGVKADLADLGKSLTFEDAKKKYEQDFADIVEARKFLSARLAEERKKAAQAERDGLRLEAVGRAEDRAAQRAEAEKQFATAKSAAIRLINEQLVRDEAAARAKSKSEEQLQVELLKLRRDAKDKEYAIDIETQQKILANKKGITAADRSSSLEAIRKVESDRQKAIDEANLQIAEAEGKARSAKLDRERKALDDVTKLAIDSAQRRIEALQTVEAQTVVNAEKLANERIELAKIKGAEEAKAFIEGTKAFKDAELTIQADVKAGKIDSREALRQLGELRGQIADGLQTGADAVSAAYNALTRKQAADEAKLRIENASAIEKARLNTIENAEIRQRELAIAEAKKQYAEELRLAGDNENLQYLAFKKFKAAQVAAETAYLEKTRTLYETSAIGLLNKLSAAIQKAFNPDPQAAEEAKKGLDELAKKEKELYKARAANSISFEDFQRQLADLSKQEAELKDKLGGIGFNVGQAFVTAFGEALGGLSEVMREQTTKSAAEYATMGSSIMRTDADIAALREESQTADVARQAEITKEIAGLEKNREKAAREASEAATVAYSSMAISVGSSLAQMTLSGKANIGEMVIAVLNGLQALVPVFAAQIYGAMVSSPNPINIATLGGAGLLAATGLTLGLTALVEIAKAAVRSGYKTGGYTGDAPADEVTGLVHGQEIVFEAPIVRGQKKDVLELRRIMQSGVSAADILNAYKRPPMLSDWSVGATGVLTMPQPPCVEYRREQTVFEFMAALARVESRVRDISVNMPVVYKQDNGELLKELRAIRAELAEVKAAQYETAKEYRAHTSVEMHVTSDTEVIAAKLKRGALKNILRG